jgi:hypothetical protein
MKSFNIAKPRFTLLQISRHDLNWSHIGELRIRCNKFQGVPFNSIDLHPEGSDMNDGSQTSFVLSLDDGSRVRIYSNHRMMKKEQ